MEPTTSTLVEYISFAGFMIIVMQVILFFAFYALKEECKPKKVEKPLYRIINEEGQQLRWHSFDQRPVKGEIIYLLHKPYEVSRVVFFDGEGDENPTIIVRLTIV